MAHFRSDSRGSFAVLTAIAFPVAVMVLVSAIDLYYVSSQKQHFTSRLRSICYQTLNMTRTNFSDEVARRRRGEEMFDRVFADTSLTNLQRTITTSWLSTSISATATIEALFGIMVKDRFDIAASHDCSGIPPYPHDGEVLLSSNFRRRNGQEIYLNRNPRCWGVITHKTVGWDGSRGLLELQDWTPGNGCWVTERAPYPPVAFGSNYAIELDSDYNSSMWKVVELHPGKYRFELWYYGRLNDTSSNGISVSIAGHRRENPIPKKTVIRIAEPARHGWIYRRFDFTVPEYEIYKIELAAIGRSDSFGGIINGFKLIYVDR